MTGFGRAVTEYNNKKISIDVKSLNSKTTDINTRIPGYYKEKELEIRRILSQELQRGKIDLCMYVELNGGGNSNQINSDLVTNYYNQLKDICTKNNIPIGQETISSIMRLPDVLKNNSEDLTDEEWKIVLETVSRALSDCNDFRKAEGSNLEKDILANLNSVLSLLTEVPQYEKERIDTIRERLKQNLKEIVANNSSDENRYEQEIIFYLEKLDINEEKVRLKKHCEYFLETIKAEDYAGKKLGFIAQEIGREINTLGSKAHHVEIQKLVVRMKDELEKIKEQLLNAL
ncbi:MAG: YicC family protein [Bacteroidales bacterium]|nr:YicC family protein [Bacteroidales bacterium]